MNKNVEKVEGEVIDCLPNGQFIVETGGEKIRCYLAGKMQQNKIKVILRDKVILVFPKGYSETLGRIIYRK